MNVVCKCLCIAMVVSSGGCGTINTVFRADAVTSQNLKDSHSYCEAVPRVYSGASYQFCTLHAEPRPEASLGDISLSSHAGALLPLTAIDFVASGVLDTVLLPYTIYRQNKDGSIEIFR